MYICIYEFFAKKTETAFAFRRIPQIVNMNIRFPTFHWKSSSESIRIHSQDLLITFSEFNLCIIIYFVLLFSLTYLHLPAQPLATVLRHGGHVACMVRLSCFNTCTFTCQPHKPRSHPTSLYQYGPTRKM
jgi:hypothetical protein